MLEFIVLGKVPGTDIHLSFTAVLILALLVLIARLSFLIKHQIRENQRQAEIHAKAL